MFFTVLFEGTGKSGWKSLLVVKYTPHHEPPPAIISHVAEYWWMPGRAFLLTESGFEQEPFYKMGRPKKSKPSTADCIDQALEEMLRALKVKLDKKYSP